MMTHNCLTHSAVSKRADDYRKVTVLTDASTTATQLLQLLVLDGISTWIDLATADQALASAPSQVSQPRTDEGRSV